MKNIGVHITGICFLLAIILIATPVAAATTQPTSQSSGAFINPGWKVNGLYRSGMVWIPGDQTKRPKNGWPCVFVFHGHGGSDRSAMRGFAIEKSWPEAVVIYLKGLPTKGLLTDPEGNRPGWDMRSEPKENRDIALFDAVLEWAVKEQHIDPARVFVTGHSNGGGFTYTLWAYRGDKLAAVAPSAASAYRVTELLKPKPAMIMGAQNDPLVKFEWQDAMIRLTKKLNQCRDNGKQWNTGGPNATWYDSATNNPLVTLIHDRGHGMPQDAGQRISDFFKQISVTSSQ